MAKVRVHNLNQFDHTEKFRGDVITIKAGEFIIMEREDAVLFKSAFTPPVKDKGGLQKPESFKMIKLEIIDENEEPAAAGPKDHVCQACGFKAMSAAGLKSHIRSNHVEQMIDDDARTEINKEA